MSKHAKLLKRLASIPKDFAWSELTSLMTSLGYQLVKTGGSGRKFIFPATGATLYLHEPHPQKVLKAYQVHDAVFHLEKNGYLP